MNNKTILISLSILVSLVASGFLLNAYKDRQVEKETTKRVESEMRFKQLQKEAMVLVIQKDSIASIIKEKQVLIDYLENNPQVIIQNNDKIHLDINRLDAYNSIVLFTNNVSKYEGNRNRYNLHRFDSHD